MPRLPRSPRHRPLLPALLVVAMPVWRGVGQGLHRMWASTVEAGARHPVLFGCGVTCVKTACTDLFVQTTVSAVAVATRAAMHVE